MSDQDQDRISEFERSLAELEALVERLESGELTLEESLNEFERGVRLSRACQASLKAAELKIEALLDKDGETAVEPFDPGTDNDTKS